MTIPMECSGCGSREDIDVIQARGHISCCPERKMVPSPTPDGVIRERGEDAAEQVAVLIVEWLASEGAMRHRTPEDDTLKIEGLIRVAFKEDGRRPDGPGLSELREEVAYWRRDLEARLWSLTARYSALKAEGRVDAAVTLGHEMRSALASYDDAQAGEWHDRCDACGEFVLPSEPRAGDDEISGHARCLAPLDAPAEPEPADSLDARASAARAALAEPFPQLEAATPVREAEAPASLDQDPAPSDPTQALERARKFASQALAADFPASAKLALNGNLDHQPVVQAALLALQSTPSSQESGVGEAEGWRILHDGDNPRPDVEWSGYLPDKAASGPAIAYSDDTGAALFVVWWDDFGNARSQITRWRDLPAEFLSAPRPSQREG